MGHSVYTGTDKPWREATLTLLYCRRHEHNIRNHYTVLRTNDTIYRGVATGVYIGIYTPQKKSAEVNFLWGKNDVRTAIQQFYTPKKTFIPPKQISGYAPDDILFYESSTIYSDEFYLKYVLGYFFTFSFF